MNAALNSYVTSLPRAAKRLFVVLLDVNICILAVLCAYYLRLGMWIQLNTAAIIACGVSAALVISLFSLFGFYKAIFRYVGASSLDRITQATLLYGVIYSIIFTSIGIDGVPRTVGLIQPILVYIFVLASRILAYMIFSGRLTFASLSSSHHRVLIYGAGEAGRQLALAIRLDKEMKLVGFVEDDGALIGRSLAGVPIYNSAEVTQVAVRRGASEVLMAVPSAKRSRRMEIVRTLIDAGLKVRTLPTISDLAHGRVSVTDLREVQIDDLLGRASVEPNLSLLYRNISDKVVMVTGAGGSIGSELARQIQRLAPKQMILVDASEFHLYAITHELTESAAPGSTTTLVPLLASVCDAPRMRQIMETWRPDTIYHAAAYKHVPMVEWNVVDGVRNNVAGTLVTATLAQEIGVQNFTLISTDKAVRPTNIMGASKRLAEMILQSLSGQSGSTRFSMVRFGNVLGSSGSVVPLFRKQIAAGGPVTVTDERMTRYFMTIPEAAQLVIQAAAMAEGGDVFLLDMGEPVRIIDLARNMIELSGLHVRDDDNPEGDIAIEVVGLRHGEKLYEELLIEADAQTTHHPGIMRAKENCPTPDQLRSIIDDLQAAFAAGDGEAVRSILKRAVPEFVPSSDLADLVVHARNNDRPAQAPDTPEHSPQAKVG